MNEVTGFLSDTWWIWVYKNYSMSIVGFPILLGFLLKLLAIVKPSIPTGKILDLLAEYWPKASQKIVPIAVGLLLVATCVSASPFLVCDPQAGVSSYQLTGPAWVPATVPAQPDGSLKMDLAGSTVGTNSLTVKACASAGSIWGEQCSASVPFVFTRPAPPATTANIRLIQ